MIRSGRSKSRTAVPSARNSGFDRTSKQTPGWAFAASCLERQHNSTFNSIPCARTTHNLSDRLCRPTGNRRLFHNDLVLCSHASYGASCCLDKVKVCGIALAHPMGLGWGIDANKYEVSVLDSLLDIRREAQFRFCLWVEVAHFAQAITLAVLATGITVAHCSYNFV